MFVDVAGAGLGHSEAPRSPGTQAVPPQATSPH